MSKQTILVAVVALAAGIYLANKTTLTDTVPLIGKK